MAPLKECHRQERWPRRAPCPWLPGPDRSQAGPRSSSERAGATCSTDLLLCSDITRGRKHDVSGETRSRSSIECSVLTFKSVSVLGINSGWLPPSLKDWNVLRSLWEPSLRGHMGQSDAFLLVLCDLTSWVSESSCRTRDFIHSHFLLPFTIWLVPS